MQAIEQTLFEMFNHLIQKHPELAPTFEKMSVAVANKSNPAVILQSLWFDQAYVLANLPNATQEFLEQHKHVNELEHQVGRFFNMRSIADEIIRDQIDGDIVEFGTWRGLGLILLGRCFANDNVKRKLIGIDSFEGLPETSTIWQKGQFNNTSYDYAYNNIRSNISPDQEITLIKGWFSDPSVSEGLLQNTKSVALIHFDADLGSSTTQALKIIEPYLVNRRQPMFFLFDDWGCAQDEVPDAFHAWLDEARIKFNLQAHKLSSTKVTRYFKITFNQDPA